MSVLPLSREEADVIANTLTGIIRAKGGLITRIGIHPQAAGLVITATIDARDVAIVIPPTHITSWEECATTLIEESRQANPVTLIHKEH